MPTKLSSTIRNYPGVKNRNPFQNELEILSDLVLEDIIKDEAIEKEFLEACYCKSGAISNYSSVSKQILLTRYSYLFELNDKKADLQSVESKKGISSELVELFASSISKRPILLIGDVGAGKTTFINNLLKVEAPKVFEKSITFKIDLGSQAIIALDIKKAVIDEINEQLITEYNINIEDDDFVRHCYYIDLEKFKKNVRVKRLYDANEQLALEKEIEFLATLVDNKANHTKKSLEYLSKNQKKQIVIFIDNCDQRSDKDQETAFLIAQEFASEWPVIVFVSIRPETFHRAKKLTGALSGYHTKAFTIPPPRLEDVIRKRLAFARKITRGEIQLSRLNNKTSFSSLDSLIHIFNESLERNNSLYEFLENISNGNIRKSIELIKKFLGSGHVDTQKILDRQSTSGYYIPLHEFLRAVIYGDNVYYNPDSSYIINMFDIHNYDPKEHFLNCLLLGILHSYMTSSKEQGFVKIDMIFSSLQGYGFIPDQIDSCINFCYSRNLLETSERGNKLDFDNDLLKLRITNLGVYHICNLVNSFVYIDAVLIDTPIFDSKYRSKISDIFDIESRLERADIFRQYLDNEWNKLNIEKSHFNWLQKSIELDNDIKKINKRSSKK